MLVTKKPIRRPTLNRYEHQLQRGKADISGRLGDAPNHGRSYPTQTRYSLPQSDPSRNRRFVENNVTSASHKPAAKNQYKSTTAVTHQLNYTCNMGGVVSSSTNSQSKDTTKGISDLC